MPAVAGLVSSTPPPPPPLSPPPPMEEVAEEPPPPPTTTRRHPFAALPLELRLLVWEAFGAEPRVFEYREDTLLVRPAREPPRHPRRVGLGVCAESRRAVRALLRPFPHPLDVQQKVPSGGPGSPPQPTYIPASDIVYLPPLVYRSRLGAWDSPWTTKPGFRNVGLHWSVLPDERRIAEALRECARCFTDAARLLVFVEFRPLPQPEEEVGDGGVVRLLGPAEDEFRLPPLFSTAAHGLMDEFWTWGELRAAIETVRRGMKAVPEVEGVLYCREVEALDY